LDLADLHSFPEPATQAVEIFGKIIISINNGGVSNRGDILNTIADIIKKNTAVNFFSQMALTS